MNAEQRRRFLLELRHSGNVNFACYAAGCDRRTVYAVRRDDRVFEGLWRKAVDAARVDLDARLRAEGAAA